MTISHSSDQRVALKEAAHWYSTLCAGEAAERSAGELEAWLAQDPLHRWAWGRVGMLQAQLGNLPGRLAFDSFQRRDRELQSSRRTVLRALLLGAGVGATGWLGYRYSPAGLYVADAHSARGEVRMLTLPDGSRLTLNSASAVDLRFSELERRVLLRQGEVMIETGKDPVGRPFLVETGQGVARALGTRFSVRRDGSRSEVKVYENLVEVTGAQGQQHLLGAGESVQITPGELSIGTHPAFSDAWVNGILAVENMPLTQFADELARYRSGFVRCAPELAQYRISGAFRIDDTDQALQAITRSFPARVQFRTRYWVNIAPE